MRTVCLGDSITFGYGVRSNQAWPALVQEKLGGEWINKGVTGDTAQGMLIRLCSEVFPLHPDYVLIMGGVNDVLIGASIEPLKSSFMAMVHQCVAKRVKPVIGIPYAVLPSREMIWSEIVNYSGFCERYAEYIRWLKKLCEGLHLRTIDFFSVLEHCKELGNTDRIIQADGLHLTVLGHKLLAETVVESRIWYRV